MTRIVLATLLMLAAGPLLADVLIIDEVRQVERMELPENGMSKTDVEAKFGAPGEREAAIGNPPISQWKYDDYSVYFEYDLVLFTVLHPGAVIEDA